MVGQAGEDRIVVALPDRLRPSLDDAPDLLGRLHGAKGAATVRPTQRSGRAVYDRSMSQPVRRLRVPADLERLADVRRLVREGATDAGAPEGVVDDLVQGVDEAATNAITHGYAGRAGWVEVGVGGERDGHRRHRRGRGTRVRPTSRPEPDMSVSPLVRGPHGMGIHLMRLATDAIAHRPRDGRRQHTDDDALPASPRPKEDR